MNLRNEFNFFSFSIRPFTKIEESFDEILAIYIRLDNNERNPSNQTDSVFSSTTINHHSSPSMNSNDRRALTKTFAHPEGIDPINISMDRDETGWNFVNYVRSILLPNQIFWISRSTLMTQVKIKFHRNNHLSFKYKSKQILFFFFIHSSTHLSLYKIIDV